MPNNRIPMFLPNEPKYVKTRKNLLRQAKRGNIKALAKLWQKWGCRLPLVEAKVGWCPTEPRLPLTINGECGYNHAGCAVLEQQDVLEQAVHDL